MKIGILVGLVCVAACRAQSTAPVTVVNAADYVWQISPGSIATAFGSGLPVDSGAGVNVCFPQCVPATVISAYPTQISFVAPDGIAPGTATVQVMHGATVAASGTVTVSSLSPGIFTADNSGTGIFNGQSYDA